MEPCLTPEQIEAIVADAMPPEQRSKAKAHLRTCDRCRAAIEAHRSGTRLADEVQQAHRTPPPTQPQPPKDPDETIATDRFSKSETRARSIPYSAHSRNVVETGVTIDDFRVEGRLGAGGMGVVYKARQLSLDRLVALKILGAALTRPSDIIRFQREAQAAARLKHPNIAAIYYVGQDQDACYIAMEYIEGPSLRQVIDTLSTSCDQELNIDTVVDLLSRSPMSAPKMRFDDPTEPMGSAEGGGTASPKAEITPEAKELIRRKGYIDQCCALVRDAANALSHAHEQTVVHRDIKPDNLLVDREGQVHLIDFGIARFFEDASITNTGQLVGTPMYMSPEQVSGRLDVDHRSDVYSLGLVLHEILSLRPPFPAPTREAVLRRVVTKPLPPLRWHNDAVDQDLEAVAHKASARDPDDRYQSADDFAADLQRLLDGKAVQARPYRYVTDDREIAAARPPLVILAAFSILAAAFVIVFEGIRRLGIMPLNDIRSHLNDITFFFGRIGTITDLPIDLNSAWMAMGDPICIIAVGIVHYFVATRVLIGNQKARVIGLLLSLAWLATLLYLIKQRDSILTPETLGLMLAAGSLVILASRKTGKWCRFSASIRRQSLKPASAKGRNAAKPAIMRRPIRPAALALSILLVLAIPGAIYLHERVLIANVMTVHEKLNGAYEAAIKHPDSKDVSRYADALRSARELLGTDHPYTCAIKAYMAAYCFRRGMVSRAEQLSREFMDGLSPKSDVIEEVASLGELALEARRYELAESMLTWSVNNGDRFSLAPLIECLLAQGKFQDLDNLLEKYWSFVLSICKQLHSSDDPSGFLKRTCSRAHTILMHAVDAYEMAGMQDMASKWREIFASLPVGIPSSQPATTNGAD